MVSELGVLNVDLLGDLRDDVSERPEAVLVGDVLDAGDGAVRVDELVAARLHVLARLRLISRVGDARLLPQDVVGRLEAADGYRGQQSAQRMRAVQYQYQGISDYNYQDITRN